MKGNERNGALQTIVHGKVGVKLWLAAMPGVDSLRPSACPVCGRAGCPPGASLGIIGHGLRERQFLGPPGPGQLPKMVLLLVRRFLCECGAVLTVVPCETIPGRLYTSSAVGWALALFGVQKLSDAEVRRQTSPWTIIGQIALTGWATLRRWIRAIRAGTLLSGLRASPSAFTARQVAERAALGLASLGPPPSGEASVATQAFQGAALAMR
ncbi:MAG TPA: hypothetical protein VF550_21385 [Polyangia bacterium]